jgi:O-antigen ligase
LALWHYRHGILRHARSTPSPLYALSGLLLCTAVVYSGSRLGSAFTVLAATGIILVALWHTGRRSPVRVALILLAALISTTLAAWWVARLDSGALSQRYKQIGQPLVSESMRGRVLGMELTREMIRDHPWTGVGAAGFKYLEPVYNQRYPLLLQFVDIWSDRELTVHRYILNDSHNDFLQSLAEEGIIGLSVILLMPAFGATALIVRRHHPLAVASLIALGVLLLYALVDFPFLNPALLSALASLMIISCRWADMEQPAPGPAVRLDTAGTGKA